MGVETVHYEAVFDCSPIRAFEVITDFEALPDNIYGLTGAEVLSREGPESVVAFDMKLPFPVGRLSWVNHVRAEELDDRFVASWSLVSGDLVANEGRISLSSTGSATRAEYRVRVATRTKLPKKAQRLATSWLLPRVVGRLRAVAESE